MFLDTANIAYINECIKTGIFKGVTTNPTILLKEKKDRFEQIEEILNTNVKILFVQLIGSTVSEQYEDYKKLKAINTIKQIGYKVPINLEGLEVISKIKADNPGASILGTAIYSAEQGILAALSGCNYVAPYVNRMENNDIDPFKVISSIRKFYDNRELNCKIIAASFKNTNQILKALESGADTCTISPELFMEMINKELALNAIKAFNEDSKKLENITK